MLLQYHYDSVFNSGMSNRIRTAYKISRKTLGNHLGYLHIGGKILLKRILTTSGCGVDLTCSRYGAVVDSCKYGVVRLDSV
jgi:hypothetical protein